MRCSTLRGTFCSLITLATPRQDWTGSNPSRREGGGCGFTLSRLHSCCAVRLVYIQISPIHIWTTLYIAITLSLKTSYHKTPFHYQSILVFKAVHWFLFHYISFLQVSVAAIMMNVGVICTKKCNLCSFMIFQDIIKLTLVLSNLLSYWLTYLLTPWSRVHLEKLIGSQLVKKFPASLEPEGSLPHSQVSTNCPYPEPARSVHTSTSHFL